MQNDEALVARAAGLYEGEGTVTGNGPDKGRRCVVAIGMTELEPMRWMVELFGGKIYGPYTKEKAHYKPYWRWVLGHKHGIVRFFERVWPWISQRRKEQATPFLENLRKVRGRSERTRPNVYLDRAGVRRVQKLLGQKLTITEISRQTGASREVIRRIKRGTHHLVRDDN